MIKKFNENWNSLNDINFDLKVIPNENWSDTYKRAKNLAIKKNKNIKYDFNGIIHIVKPKTFKDRLYDEYLDNINNKGVTIGEVEYWDRYWNEKSKDPDFEMDTIAEYAKKNGISYEDATQYFYNPTDKNDFSDDIQVLGLPSGQIIYMNSIQIKYFVARNLVAFVKIWKKPMYGGAIKPIKLDSYCFEDKNYSEIIDKMNYIVW